VAEEALKFEYTSLGLNQLKEHALEVSLINEQEQETNPICSYKVDLLALSIGPV